MQERPNIAVFIDYDNIEIGVKSTLGREFDVALALNALKERGDVVAKFAYANWGRQEGATRKMAENAVQMVQRIPSPRGDKNGADINLALDALEMAFTHDHINAFAIVSGDSDFIPLVNKLREYGKTVYVLGGKAFTSTILQQNCHEFISYESLLDEAQKTSRQSNQRAPKRRQPALDPAHAMPLVERALQVLERRGVQPQLGLLKSTMLQLDPAFSEKDYGAGSFSEFVEKLRNAGYVELSGSEGRYVIERKTEAAPPAPLLDPEEALPLLRDVLETHRLELENGRPAEEVEAWFREEHPDFNPAAYGFREFAEFLNYAQDKLVVRVEPHEEKGLLVYLGAEFYPPADFKVPVVAPEPAEVPKKRRTSRRKRTGQPESVAAAAPARPRRRRESAPETVQ
ncbi:MAG: NYN domain-containing protein [Bryobacterales bacterium]|nr:NYN domain-containing protein [Bryobacterales bacterium]